MAWVEGSVASPQKGDLRLYGPPSGQGADGGARTRDKRVPANLRADSQVTVPPIPSKKSQIPWVSLAKLRAELQSMPGQGRAVSEARGTTTLINNAEVDSRVVNEDEDNNDNVDNDDYDEDYQGEKEVEEEEQEKEKTEEEIEEEKEEEEKGQ
ncbi:hypothetical protein PoB_006624500 [Plakobranchus ocellatus]|uniref:Uncharacterized protein n=1 Tax=Plakobranchus ocellatus TaxID=259542 RepID=A0AAV4D6N7_9GAST|nr:hypothetical protein PoB_006624500 [Plakobranchus ocellatus]